MSIPGEWTAYSCAISKDAESAFEEAVKDLVGVKYIAIAVSEQGGVNRKFSFFCNAQGVYLRAQPEGAIVEVYRAEGEKAIITRIKIIDH